jgi:serine/threonine protein kinase
LRICPECEARTDERLCPIDGTRTVPRLAHDVAVDPQIGAVIAARYRIDAALGGGGMGTVYRATQLSVDRPVALKLLRPEIARDLAAAARFQREARVIAGLTHPNTVDLIDFGQLEDDRLYLVMELVEGESFTDFIARCAPVAPARVGHLLRQLLEPLAEAHAKGIVHRDLKPENVIVARVPGKRDFLKLLDFGIARIEGEGEAGHGALTGEGVAIGSPRYMSPEQAQGLAVGPPSDVYAVGLLAWELLTGGRPFEASTPRGWLTAHIAQPLPALAVNGAPVAEPYRSLVLRCLEKDPGRRFADAMAVLDWLRERGALTTGPHVAESPPDAMATGQAPMPDTERRRRALAARERELATPRRAPWAALVAVAGALLAGAAGVGWFVGAQRSDDTPGPEATAASSALDPASNTQVDPGEIAGSGAPSGRPDPPSVPELVAPVERASPVTPSPGRRAGEVLVALSAKLPPEIHVVELTSDPPGAAITRDDVLLARTPARVAWLATEPAPALLIEAPDHAPARLRLIPADAASPRHVVLNPLRRPAHPAKARTDPPSDYRRTGKDPYTLIH